MAVKYTGYRKYNMDFSFLFAYMWQVPRVLRDRFFNPNVDIHTQGAVSIGK